MKIKVNGRELEKKLLSGEKDFSSIILENFVFREELQEYLKKQDFKKEPLIIKNSEFRFVKAKNLFLPYVVAAEAEFYICDFIKVNFEHGNFYKAKFKVVNFVETNFGEANLEYASFEKVLFRKVNFYLASLWNSRLEKTIFEEVNI